MHKIIIIKFVCLGEARWGRSPAPRVKESNFILSKTYVSSDESSRKCRKVCEACSETPEIRHLNKHMELDKLKYWRVVQWVKSLGETLMTGFHT